MWPSEVLLTQDDQSLFEDTFSLDAAHMVIAQSWVLVSNTFRKL